MVIATISVASKGDPIWGRSLEAKKAYRGHKKSESLIASDQVAGWSNCSSFLPLPHIVPRRPSLSKFIPQC